MARSANRQKYILTIQYKLLTLIKFGQLGGLMTGSTA